MQVTRECGLTQWPLPQTRAAKQTGKVEGKRDTHAMCMRTSGHGWRVQPDQLGSTLVCTDVRLTLWDCVSDEQSCFEHLQMLLPFRSHQEQVKTSKQSSWTWQHLMTHQHTNTPTFSQTSTTTCIPAPKTECPGS